ncbi:hypothetical protein N6L24_14555 [Cognatishimia sp. SS12]|uniref:hypothetical protein n=1 Tax=Cognatishimia sp. SS12 TaxID=2979465 RepID=UPI00232FEB21|nr:hypothetical protein [Cognatishimia sp. SS12]MDC0739507.1 hypothetical protein [Cognatishimia sp. SS12]
MTQNDDTHLSAPALLRRLTRDAEAMGPRLAQLEYQLLAKELETPGLFDLDLTIEATGHAEPLRLPDLNDMPQRARAVALNVTLGKTAWVETPEALPVIGVLVRSADLMALQHALAALLKQHYQQPFARFVFLCTTMRPIPFLGRYEFTYDYIATENPLIAAQRLKLRYEMQQIRDLITGREIWRAPKV